MARLASAAKGGYYPLPETITPLIVSHISSPHGGRVLDPCAGKGVALAAMATALGVEAYGVELNQARALNAANQIQALTGRQDLLFHDHHPTRFIQGDYRTLVTSKGGYNLLYLNPPYDFDQDAGRLEYQWLRDCREWLQPDGLLIYVVPQKILGYSRIARYLATWFSGVHIFRFPDEEYPAFKQVVLFGRRRPRAQRPDLDQVQHYREIANLGKELAPLTPADKPTYLLPKPIIPSKRFVFRSEFIDPDDAEREAGRLGIQTLAEWQQHLAPANGQAVPVTPLVPLKIGHMAGLMAAGFLDNQVLMNGNDRLLIKGRAFKKVAYSESVEQLPNGGHQLVRTATENVVTDVTTITPQGDVASHQGSELEGFMTKWLPQLANHVATNFPPAYAFDYQDGPYAKTLNQLSLQRPIPTLDRGGLLPAQKHAAAALVQRLQKHSDALLVGEMGTGKAQPLDSKILTPTGWKRIGDVRVGDAVVNPAGGTAYVTGVFPQGKKAIYRVTFSDGAQTECCDEHLWQVTTPERKWRGQAPQIFELSHIRRKLFSKSGNARYFLPIVAPVEFHEQSLPLDPYLLGVLIGDGGLSGGSVMFSTSDDEILESVKESLPGGVSVKHQEKYDYRISYDGPRRPEPNLVLNALRELGLFGHRAESKFIPEPYLFASVESRIALLQGLMDTDGTAQANDDGTIRSLIFNTVSHQLASDVIALIRSLGGTAKMATRNPFYTYKGEKRFGQLAYRISIKLPDHIRPFRLTRKLERANPPTKYGVTRAMVKVEYVGRKEAQCIALDSSNQLYVTDDYIVTHNTTIGAAVAACLEADRTLVLCPPHLVNKWKREAEIVWPECQVKILKTISDVQTWFKLDTGPDTGRPRIAVLSHSKAKLASGWRHAYAWWQPNKDTVEKHADRLEARFGSEWRKRLRAAFARYQQNRGLRCPTCGASQFDKDGLPVWPEDFEKSRRRRSCPNCHAPLYQFDRRRSKKQQSGSFQEYARREAIIKEALENPSPWTADRLSAGYFPESEGYARWPLADYIRTHYKGQVDLFIADEIHQFKASDSDQGYAFHDLVCAARKTLGLTGTIFGGKASSLFHLLYRLGPEIQRAFTDEDQSGQRRQQWKRWVSTYGVLQEIETSKIDPASGKLTGNSRSNVRTKELPGASPAMLPWLLNRAVFVSLADMGFALPNYEEVPVTVSMSPEMALLYTSLYKQLHEELKERLVRNDKSLLGAYLQSLLSWVDSPWRPEIVIDPHTKDREDKGIEPRILAEIPGLPADQLFPKEKAIIDLVQKEKRAGRRCMLFCQQTASRDITPRWREILAEAGLKAAVLKVDPEKREAWVAKQVDEGVDVIITHPRRVETGMDLLDFPTLIWMGTEYSVYTVMQASRRSWRIGQDQPVKVYFFNYADTLQNDALYLIAAKVAATVRVNGDVVGGDSLAELDELASTDMVTALARIVTEDDSHRVKGLNDVFAEANAEMKSANGFIGAFEMPDEAPSNVRLESQTQVSRPQIIIRRARIEVTPDDQFVAIPVNGHNDPELNGAAGTNGKMPVTEDDKEPSAVPRPRLVFGQSKRPARKARKRRSSRDQGRNLSLFDALS